MFNGLQEGILTIDSRDNLDFMNMLSNGVLSHVAGVENFLKKVQQQFEMGRRRLGGYSPASNLLHKKIFHVSLNASKMKKKGASGSGDE